LTAPYKSKKEKKVRAGRKRRAKTNKKRNEKTIWMIGVLF
jgi:hypothetical protein